jgi:hypothetical protein
VEVVVVVILGVEVVQVDLELHQDLILIWEQIIQ